MEADTTLYQRLCVRSKCRLSSAYVFGFSERVLLNKLEQEVNRSKCRR